MRHLRAGAVQLLVVFAVPLATVVVMPGCTQAATAPPAVQPPPATNTAAKPAAETPSQGRTLKPFATIDLRPASGSCVGPDVGPPLSPSLQPYEVPASLSGVANLRAFSKELSRTARTKLAKNLFVIAPAKYEQLFYIYNQDSMRARPSFMTVDGALHLWHLGFDYTLRYIERTSLLKKLEAMTREMLSAATHLGAQRGEFEASTRARVIAYFMVPARLLELNDLPPIPEPIAEMVNADLARIDAHRGPARSAVTGWMTQFDLFKPRGHYTRRPEYKRFFRAMSWYGNAYWAFPSIGSDRAAQSAAAAAIIAELLYDPRHKTAADNWQAIYEATQWFVGGADDVTPAELLAAERKFFGHKPSLRELLDPDTAARLAVYFAEHLRAPMIKASAGDFAYKNMRFMGTRFIPDSYVMHNLVWDRVAPVPDGTKRLLPRGLDIMAALGSPRARHHLTALYHDDRFPRFTSNLAAMHKWLAHQPPERWVSNMYWGWFWVLSAVVEPKGAGFPSFMTTDAWQDKQLLTALSSWAELRHDTILYAKGVMAEGDGPELPPPPKGYVEPDVQAWRRLEALADLSLRGLLARGLLTEDDDMAQALESVRDHIRRLRQLAEKELSGQRLTTDDYRFIWNVGSTLEWLQLALLHAAENQYAGAWFEIKNPVERRMACIADVATGGRRRRWS